MSSLIRRLQRSIQPRREDEGEPCRRRARKKKSVTVGACSRLDRDSWAAASAADRREYQLERLANRRRRQAKQTNSYPPADNSISEANRHGGEHQDNREIERRRHQAERKARNAGGG